MLCSELFTDDKVDLKVLKELALGMRWAGMPEGTIPLTSADPDFKPAIEIREAMTDFIKGGYFPYAPDALPGLREAISCSLKTRKNEDVPPEFIQPVDSASACMHAIALSVLKPGDEVKLGCFTVEPIHVNHSICCSAFLHATPEPRSSTTPRSTKTATGISAILKAMSPIRRA